MITIYKSITIEKLSINFNKSCSYFEFCILRNLSRNAEPIVFVEASVEASFSGTNGHPNPSLAHGRNDAKGFQRTSYDASTHDREPTWRNENDGGTG